MLMENPFSEDKLKRLFIENKKYPGRIANRESTTIEFKANFHKGSSLHDYGRTMAGFANNTGGYLIFGIGNNPRDLIGMTNKTFVDFDSALLSEYLNSKFSPEIIWDSHIHYIENKEFGLLYTFESKNKPIISVSNGGDIYSEGEIFYRYRARTQKIKYTELKQILDKIRSDEQAIWLSHLSRISKIGPENAAIFNPFDGTVSGKSGSFVIDENLVKKLHFIREGNFKPITGEPTIKVVGEAEIISTGEIISERIIVREHGIHEENLILNFLSLLEPDSPLSYILEIPYLHSAYLPIYFYIKKSELSINQIIEEIKSLNHCNNGVRSRLIDRLNSIDPRVTYEIPNTNTEPAEKKKEFRERLISKQEISPNNDLEVRYLLESIQTLSFEEIDIDYVLSLLKQLYDKFWSSSLSITKTTFRKAICHVDLVIFRHSI